MSNEQKPSMGERMITPERNAFTKTFIPCPEDSAGTKIRKIAVFVLIVIILVLIIYLIIAGTKGSEDSSKNSADDSAPAVETVIITVPETEVTTVETTVSETETTTETTTVTTPAPLKPLVILDSIADEYAANKNIAGKITMDGTAIKNSTVVQCEDNDFYLDHGVNGNSSYAGALFVDFRCVINDYDKNQSDNVVIYGHNQKDGSMFGTLQYYKVKKSDTSRFDFYKEHPTFTYTSLYDTYTYKIVAAFIVEAEQSQARDGIIFDCHNFVLFNTEKRSFDNWVKNLNEHTAFFTGVDMKEGDKFMTLSTCSNEFEPSRFLVVGRRVRDGEDPTVDTSKAVLNPDAKEPDLNFIYGR